MKVEITVKHNRAHNRQPHRAQVQFKVGEVREVGVDITAAMAKSILDADMGKEVKGDNTGGPDYDNMSVDDLKVCMAQTDQEYKGKKSAIKFLKGE